MQLGTVAPTTPATPATTEAVPATAESTDAPDIMDAHADAVLADEILPDEVLFDSLAQISIPGHLSLECDGICKNAMLNGDIAIAVDTDRRSFALENIYLQDIDEQFFLRENIRRLLMMSKSSQPLSKPNSC